MSPLEPKQQMESSKHFEVSFVDGSTETVMGELPQDIFYPLFVKEGNEIKILEIGKAKWWTCTLLAASPDQAKLVPHGRIHINLSNITFIKEC